MSRSRNWMFTLNNPQENELQALLDACKQAAWQLERGDQGTEHFQGYVEFSSMKALNQLKRFVPRAHWEKRRGNQAQAFDYCTKDDTRLSGPFYHPGDWHPNTQGKRTDLVAARELLKTKRNFAEAVDDDELTAICAKYPKFVHHVISHANRPGPMIEPMFRPWQAGLMEKLSNEPDPRKIHWYVDPVGNNGKSFMTRYLVRNKGAIMLIGKRADIYHAYEGQSIVVFDYTRAQQDQVDYTAIESLKNALVFSSKYESKMKVFEVPHVIVFSNWEPDVTKLSVDRWDISRLSGQAAITPAHPTFNPPVLVRQDAIRGDSWDMNAELLRAIENVDNEEVCLSCQ